MKISDSHTTIIQLTAEEVERGAKAFAIHGYTHFYPLDQPAPAAPTPWSGPPPLPGDSSIPAKAEWNENVSISRADDGGAIVTITRTR